MKFSRLRISQTTLFFAAAMVLSSCNRGYGCPTNFNLNDFLIDAGQTVLQSLVNFVF